MESACLDDLEWQCSIPSTVYRTQNPFMLFLEKLISKYMIFYIHIKWQIIKEKYKTICELSNMSKLRNYRKEKTQINSFTLSLPQLNENNTVLLFYFHDHMMYIMWYRYNLFIIKMKEKSTL